MNEARRQIKAADGVPVAWYFSQESSLKATKKLFRQRGISGIELIHKPMP